MSHAMISSRRLMSGVGLRRRAPTTLSTSYARPLMSQFEPLLLQNNIKNTTTTATPTLINIPYNHHSFSSISTKNNNNQNIVELPPNLKFDSSAKSSPFYGAEKILTASSLDKKLKKQQKKQREETTEQLEATSAAADDTVIVDSKDLSSDEKKDNVIIEASSEAIVDETEEGEDDFEEYEGEYDSDAEEEEGERILYDLSTKPDIPRAIPLPQRLHVPIIDIKTGEEVGTFHLSEKTFGNDPVRVDILHRVVVWQRNKKRGKRNAGARSKTISEKRGSGRKVRPQKGGGQARAGHSRPAHWRGGAKAHGPKGKETDYTTKLNKKVRKMGVRHALSQKLLEGNLVVTSDMAVPTHKTKELDLMLSRFGISGKNGVNALIVDDADPADAESEGSVYGGLDVNFKVASGNLYKVKVLNQLGCNVYDMLKFKKLVLSLAAVRSLEERLERV